MPTPDLHLERNLPSLPLDMLFRQLPVGICILDHRQAIHYLNPVYQDYLRRYLKLDASAALGRNWLELIPVSSETRRKIRRVYAEGRSYRADALPVRRGRVQTYWDVTLAPITLDGSRGVLISTLDVTDRVQAQRRLRRQRDQLSSVLQSMAEGLIVIDETGTIVNANYRASELLGVPIASLIGLNVRTAPELTQLHYPTGGPVPTEEMPILRALRGETLHNEVYLVHGEGRSMALMISSAPVRDGEVGYGTVVFRDITEVWTLREQLEAMVEERTRELCCALEELRQVDQLKANFLNAVSHELRTPLTAITGFAEFLDEEITGPLNPDQRHFVRQILFGTERLLSLINDLLDYARMEAGRFRLARAPVEFPPLAHRIVESLMPLAQRNDLEVRVEVPAQMPEVDADPDRLSQILTNLLSNAIKFTPAGGKVWLRGRLRANAVEISVVDTGIGIPEEALPHLFTRFYQVDPSQPLKGTGLGLAITKGLIEAHGGHIEVESKLGEGSVFRFTLPLWTEKAGDQPPR